MIKHLIILCILFIASSSSASQAEETQLDITGLWLTKNQDTAVQVSECGDEICGHIAWLHADENPYGSDGKPLCQAEVVAGFGQDKNEKNVWSGGTIHKLDEGKEYDATITLVNNNTLQLRAYLGLPALGKTKTLTRTNAQDYPPCNIPKEFTQHALDNTGLQKITPASGN